tara:strand:+ start:256 stop:546 length:291 start_codon:yes stop_codon:yes gene_type:complete
MFWNSDKREKILGDVEGERSFLVQTSETRFVFHFSKGSFYIRKVTGKDPRYCLVKKLNGKKKYDTEDLDLGAGFVYFHPRLERFVSGGTVRSISVR